MGDGTSGRTIDAASSRFRRLCVEARRLGIHIGLVRGEQHVWVATLHEPDRLGQMAWIMTVLPWGVRRTLPAGLVVRVDPPSRIAAFWGEERQAMRELAEAARRLHFRRAEARIASGNPPAARGGR
jgi:hypothetical protein